MSESSGYAEDFELIASILSPFLHLIHVSLMTGPEDMSSSGNTGNKARSGNGSPLRLTESPGQITPKAEGAASNPRKGKEGTLPNEPAPE